MKTTSRGTLKKVLDRIGHYRWLVLLSLTLAAGTTVASGAATQPIASLTAEAPATLARSAVTNAAGYAIFNVSGDVTLPAAMTFRADALPDADADVLTYGGAGIPATGTITSQVVIFTYG